MSSPVSTATTPVWPDIALIASLTSTRLAAALVVVAMAPLVLPLMVTVPVRAAAVIAEPVITVLPTTAETPVSAAERLIAATLATALATFSAELTLSSSAELGPMLTPLISRSLAISAWLTVRLVVTASNAPVADRAAVAPVPRSVARAEPMPNLMVSPARLPVCSRMFLAEPSRSLMPLKLVRVATLSISDRSCTTSAWSAARSSPVIVPLAPWTASSRMRCSMLVTSPIALSAVCARLMPSLALRMATPRPRTSEVIRVAMARPAASSLAELMRLPVDRRSIAALRLVCAMRWPVWAVSADRLVLMTVIGFPSPLGWQAKGRRRGGFA